MFTFVFAVTEDVRTVNDPVVPPAGIVMLDTVGVATAALPLDRVTTVPPAGAAHSRIRLAADVEPPATGFGDSVNVLTRIGRTVNARVFDTPA